MTPTLAGRWQTRVFLLATVGLIITLLFVLVSGGNAVFLKILGYVALFGLAWDVVYILLQRLRWDRDWPAAFQVLNGVTEGVFLYAVIALFGLPGLPSKDVPLWAFVVHYGLVWLAVFLSSQGPMRAIFPFWRFHGGRIVPRVSNEPGP